jgi:hypothetical protein
MDLRSFTFTAKRKSTDQLITFRIRPGLIPEEFFELKNQGASCSDADLKKVKQKALLSILSIEPNDCFYIVGYSRLTVYDFGLRLLCCARNDPASR